MTADGSGKYSRPPIKAVQAGVWHRLPVNFSLSFQESRRASVSARICGRTEPKSIDVRMAASMSSSAARSAGGGLRPSQHLGDDRPAGRKGPLNRVL
jgi:hypothetical protein